MSLELIQINVKPAPRGQGGVFSNTFGVQSIRGSFAWGGSPSQATIVFAQNGAPNLVGQLMEIKLGGHYFAGICKNDSAVDGSHGRLREVVFSDLREFLTWDYIHAQFNMPVRRWINGVWRKRYYHIFPSDFDTHTKTFTDRPLLASEILGLVFTAPTVGSPWTWNLTGNGLFPDGLMNYPVFAMDAYSGVRLDAFLNDLSERGGLVFTLDPVAGNNYRLVWMRKGYGLIPVLPPFTWPANSDERRLGVALSGNATNVRVVGERNRYLVLNVPLAPDWNGAWEQFLNADALFLDLFENEKDPVSGVAYNNFPNDPGQWQGANAAKVRALQITVGEYVQLRNARSGDGGQFADYKKFGGRSRIDMPAALYISSLLFRAYVPALTAVPNVNGQNLSLDSVNILDALPCRVTYDPVTGAMTADPTTLADGNGLGLVRGTMFGQDLFELVDPERVTADFFSATNRPWAAAPFSVDDSGEGQRFIIFEQPCFTSENLLKAVNGFQVLNAAATVTGATAQAALTFELEPFSYWRGTYPNVSRDRVEYVSGLCAEYVGPVGSYQEILFANGMTAQDQADQVARSLLLGQYTYVSGGYRLAQRDKPLATMLDSIIDRVEVDFSPNGFIEVVDFTTERQRRHFEPERDLERRTVQNTLFPGQQQLRQSLREYQRLGAGLKGMTPGLMNRFVQFLKGNFEPDARPVWFDPTGSVTVPSNGLVKVGTPIFGPVLTASGDDVLNTRATYPPNISGTSYVFQGVVIRDGEPAKYPFHVQTTGTALALVKGPVALLDAVGLDPSGYPDYANSGAWLIKNTGQPVGQALQVIADASVQLIKVRLGVASGGSASNYFRGAWTAGVPYATNDMVVVQSGVAAGTYVSTIDNNLNDPATGQGWVQIAPGQQVGKWV